MKLCIDCGKEIKKTSKRCHNCANKARAGYKHTEESKKIMSENRKGKNTGDSNPMRNPEIARMNGMSRRGIKYSDETREKMSKAHKGKILTEEHKRNIGIKSKEWHQIPENAKKHSDARSGDNNYNWKGGISNNPKYCKVFTDKEWRAEIYERDEAKFCWNPECLRTGKRNALHHIDYNKENCKHGNIVKICIACNSMANYNRGWWQSYYEALMHKRGIK